MASLQAHGRGYRVVWWERPDAIGAKTKLRQMVYLGPVSARLAESIRKHVEDLVGSRVAGVEPSAAAVAWLGSLPAGRLRDSLARRGLIAPEAERRAAGVPTLAEFVARFIAERTPTWRPGATTLPNYRQTERWTLDYFGRAKLLGSVTAGDIARWRGWMLTKGLGVASAGKHVKRLRGIFEAAVRDRLLSENPARGEVCRAEVAENVYVERAEFDRVLRDCSPEWRVLLVLARVCGLRVPSEVIGLAWSDIDWQRGSLRVRSPKGERFGKGERLVPLFPEVREALGALFEIVPDGSRWVLPEVRLRGKEANLRTQLHRLCRGAGVTPWRRGWVSLRASAATDLADEYPAHVCAEWVGHTVAIARRHYLKTTASHWERAVGVQETPNNVRGRSVRA